MSTLKGMKIDDFYNKGQIRADGRMIHDMYLYQVKSAKDSGTPWDYYKTGRQGARRAGLHHGGRVQVLAAEEVSNPSQARKP
jgi:hypothetical protein